MAFDGKMSRPGGSARKKGSETTKFLYVVMAALPLAAGVALWLFLAPESLARLMGYFNRQAPEIESLTVVIDGRLQALAPGAVVEMHPRESLSVQSLQSNRWLNYDLRLYSPDFDISAVTGGASAAPLALLGAEAFEDPRTLRMEIKEGQAVVAAFSFRVSFTARDLEARGDEAGDPARKAELYRKALASASETPETPALRAKLIEALTAAGRYEQAAELHEEQLAENPDDVGALTSLLELYAALGDSGRQIATLERLIRLSDSLGRPQLSYTLQLAEILKKDGQGPQAAMIYENLLRDASESQRAVYLGELIALYRDARNVSGQIETWKRLLTVLPEGQATAIWSEIIALAEKSADMPGQIEGWRALAAMLPPSQNKANAYKQMALLLVRSEKYPEARAAYLEAAKFDPEDANVYLNLARLARRQGERESYRANLLKVTELSPTRFEARLELAEAYFDDLMFDEAKAEYMTLADQKPDDAVVRLRLIALLEREGDQEHLIEQYERLLRQQPDDKVAAYNFGVLCFNEKQWDRAVEAFKKVVSLDPADAEARAYLLAVYKEKGLIREMLAEALELYRLDPSKTVYRDLMANHFENVGDWKSFARMAEEVARILPADPAGWRLLAKAQNRLGLKAEEAQSLWRAADAVKNEVEPWLTAAAALAAAGDLKQAQRAYQKVLELDPGHEKASEALLELALKELQKK
ncbi:MAG: tetratricopeptide repeat protein [Candidatus Adiutrix sp.]|nr:tetratricopeptide repeat protein [Candidatus Adiutrix sp.]